MIVLYGPHRRRLRLPRCARRPDAEAWKHITEFGRAVFSDWSAAHAEVVRTACTPLWLSLVTVVQPLWSMDCVRLGWIAKQSVYRLGLDPVSATDLRVEMRDGFLIELVPRHARCRRLSVVSATRPALVPVNDEDVASDILLAVDGIPWEIHRIEDPAVRAIARDNFLRNASST